MPQAKQLPVFWLTLWALLCQQVVAERPNNETEDSYRPLRMAIAWGAVPFASEYIRAGTCSLLELTFPGSEWAANRVINKVLDASAGNEFTFVGAYYTYEALSYSSRVARSMLESHKENFKEATSGHLIAYLSSTFSTSCYQLFTHDAALKKTTEFRQHLRERGVWTDSLLSGNAQKARKSYLRAISNMKAGFSSARLSLDQGQFDDAARLLAMSAYYFLYLQPELTFADYQSTIRIELSRHLQRLPEDFRGKVTSVLASLDNNFQEKTFIQRSYCELLNQWQLGFEPCEPSRASAQQVEESQSPTRSPPVSKKTIESIVFTGGMLLPAVVSQQLDSVTSDSPLTAITNEYLSRVPGKAMTKERLEWYSGEARRKIENWGSVSKAAAKPSHDAANKYFATMQLKTGSILARQPNFARSNLQRILEAHLTQLATIHSLSVSGNHGKTPPLLASLHSQLLQEVVEADASDEFIQASLLAYQPIKNSATKDATLEYLRDIQPGFDEPIFQDELVNRLDQWQALSTAGLGHNHMPATQESVHHKISEDSQMSYKIHVLTLSYIMLHAYVSSSVLSAFKSNKTLQGAFAFYLFKNFFAVPLRALTAPAIDHIQSTIKSWVSGQTGTVSTDTLEKQKILIRRVFPLNQRLSEEAQIARTYRLNPEPLLIRFWQKAGAMVEQGEFAKSATALAHTLYNLRYLHPEFEENDPVITALATGHLEPVLTYLTFAPESDRQDYLDWVQRALPILDPEFNDEFIQQLYRKIMVNWGILCPYESFHIPDTSYLASISDSFLGTVGIVGKSLFNALASHLSTPARLLFNVPIDIFELGTTEPQKKRIQAYARRKLMNLGVQYSDIDRNITETANQQLTGSYRRLKYHFGLSEYGERVELVQLLSVLISYLEDFEQAYWAGDPDRMHDYLAQALILLILRFPELEIGDYYVTQTISAYSPGGWQEIGREETQYEVLSKVTEQFHELFDGQLQPLYLKDYAGDLEAVNSLREQLYEELLSKSKQQLMAWSQQATIADTINMGWSKFLGTNSLDTSTVPP